MGKKKNSLYCDPQLKYGKISPEEQRPRYCFTSCLTLISGIFFIIVLIIFLSWCGYQDPFERTEKITIAPIDYLENTGNNSDIFALGKANDDHYIGGKAYKFYIRQEDGTYLPDKVSLKSTSVIKDIKPGEEPYLKRDIRRNGLVENEVLHLPMKVKIINVD